jgi:hypothetical protein
VIWCYLNDSQSKNYAKTINTYTNITSLVNHNFRVINGILLHEAIIVNPKHIVLLKKRVLTKNFTVFIKFWRFNSFFDEAFTVTSRSKTIAALRLCVLDGNATAVDSDLLSLISYRFSASFHFCRVEGFFGKNSALIEKDNTSQIEIFN